jgi:aryl-alcohol dehydrogenase-like predicted oxidoreductase
MSAKPTQEALSLHEAQIGLGAWAWGDRVFWNYGHGYTDDDIAGAFQASLVAGVNLVDTAEIYGSGRSERLLGRFVRETDQPILVATKFFPIPYRLTQNSVVRALRGSLERLGLERVYLYQIHWPSPVVPLAIYVEGLALAVKAGLTRTVGVSNYDNHQMQRAIDILAKHDVALASNQVEYNLLDRAVEKNGLLERCQELGIRLIAYSPLAMGLLTGKYTPEKPPPGVRGRKYAAVLAELQTLIGLLREIGKGHGEKTAGQVALNWVICKGALPIPGAKTATQAVQNAGAIGWRLTPDEVRALDEASDKLPR